MKPELVRDLDRAAGWWLLVENSEQSFVDLDDPDHLEFEYVQLIAYVLDVMFPEDTSVTALHLGGGLLTIPRWLAARHPGSKQVVAERSTVIAAMAARLGAVDGVDVQVADAGDVVASYASGGADVVVCDVYDGPETVTSLFTLAALSGARERLSPVGVYLCNLSDASPFELARVVAATMRVVFDTVVMLAEPPVLRGRRSGNIILVGTARTVAIDALTRRASSGPIRARVLSEGELEKFVGNAVPATDEADLPASGESEGRFLS